MSVINILSSHVADLIAAGEVVERPASVIKELMENSFDAGAKQVTVEIRGGGAPYIRVSDDGCGMAPEDAGIAFLRHATSKLKDEQGLEAIGTMGFRGEALAAIASVSNIALTTRRRGDDEGTHLTLSAGDIQDMEPCGCPEGTVITIRDIFFNTPARLKFLKSDRSEAGACVQTALRCALGRPEISVRMIRDGKEEFFSPGDGKAESAIYALLGRDMAKDMLRCAWEDEGIAVRGFVSSPSACRGNRSAQYFFCNGRYIRSAMLQSAVEQAFKNSLLPGRYPACALYLDLSFAGVDVNVHPAKTEVKFSQEKRVFDVVYRAVLTALTGEDRTAQKEIKAQEAAVIEKTPAVSQSVRRTDTVYRASEPIAKPKPREDFYRSMSAEQFRSQGYSITPPSKPHTASASLSLHSAATEYQTRLDLNPKTQRPDFTPRTIDDEVKPKASQQSIVENSVQNVESLPVPDHKIVGEALKTYIIVELNDTLMLIDKHAAHERMIFDRLKQRDNRAMAQELLEPVTLRLSEDDAEALENNLGLLSELGFEIEPFGEIEYILRALPAFMQPSGAVAAVEEICEKLRRGKAPDPQAMRDEILHTVACKAAIKGGWDTDRKELEKLVGLVLTGEIKYCPHGRPVSALLGRGELEKMFKRIV